MRRYCFALPESAPLVTLFSVALLLAIPVSALTYVPVADDALTDAATMVLRARVDDAHVVDRAGTIATVYRLAPLEVIKGDPTTASLNLWIPGGTTGTGDGQVFEGVPRLAIGEETLLFLHFGPGGMARIVHLNQGIFYPAEHAGNRYWSREPGEGDALPVASFGGQHHTVPRRADAFVRWLADRAMGDHRPADYLATELPALVPTRPLPKFTLIDAAQPIRWFGFDGGGVVRWHRHVQGQRGSSDGGASAFAAARQAFNAEPNTPIVLLDVGTTSSVDGFLRSDGRNTLLFRDIGDRIGEPFDCSTGGTLALGGFSFVSGGAGRGWKGQLFRVGVEAEIVVNDGIECLLASQPAALAQIYAHELGHTLGLGHACGDASSPSCASNAAFSRALMRARFPAHPWGAELRPDDQAGLRFLYDPTFQGDNGGGGGNGGGGNGGGGDPGACPQPNGHPRRCTECGPCVSGEGDCDSDAECAPGLVCAADRGADFGFNPNIDVCLASGGGGGGNGGGACALPDGDPRYCDQCGPCASGEGDCDRDSDCRTGLVCTDNVGAQFGFAPGIDVCLAGNGGGGNGGGGSCSVNLGQRFFCATCGACGSGQGDCDSDADCQPGLRCVDDVGAQFGFGPKIDICL